MAGEALQKLPHPVVALPLLFLVYQNYQRINDLPEKGELRAVSSDLLYARTKNGPLKVYMDRDLRLTKPELALINRFGNRLKIMTGVDTLALESLLMGAHGWIAGLVCAFPKETVAIYKLQKVGRIQEAIELYRWFMPLLELDINPKLVQNIKLAEVYTGIGTEYVRAPRLPLFGKEREEVIDIIETALSKRPALPPYKQL